MAIPSATTQYIDNICVFRTYADDELNKHLPIYEGVVKMNNDYLSASRPDGMSQKSKILSLVSLHIVSNVRQSIEFAVTAAVYVQASDDEIYDAIDAALLTGGGAAVAGSHFAMAVLKYRRGSGGSKPPRNGFAFQAK
jgi:alkylhydroperoxidase/carboxymuconolactone decarboxylase family protein YurZ